VDPDDREFMRELSLRHERATEAMIRRLDRGTEEMRLEFAKAREEHRELLESSRAHTQALFALLDKLA
jgi:hypothetical protein